MKHRSRAGENGGCSPTDEPHVSNLVECWVFLKSFLRAPAYVGSMLPSSRFLARAVSRQHDLAKAQVVVELGPGTGAITKYILPLLSNDALYVAIELDAEVAAFLSRHWPRVVVFHDSAENINFILQRLGVEAADVVISGLPWGSMPAWMQRRLLTQIRRALRTGGTFSTYAYFFTPLLPRGKAFASLLKEMFRESYVGAVTLLNIPPAIVYRAVA